ncbi:UDP-N-acetylmuramate dehydrogenase [Compostibacter hankyongensis]|uniref:UDP-N-acetylenolpyruvoylglucosamine reductase n=1 Tax=Compostibacter hankyongensis TaxID=1007089 RepID=A0ABP8G8K6_9BACT
MSTTIYEQYSLKALNTFGMDEKARYYATFSSAEELRGLLDDARLRMPAPLILGGGSNILLTRPVQGAVLKNEIRGIEKTGEDAEYVYVRAGAGENWHRFVQYCVERGWGGLENLSLIPGNVGAGPMQNIGAYGTEIRDVFYTLEAMQLKEKKIVSFSNAECGFGYRESVFKKQYRQQFAILSVTCRLLKQPRFNIAYGAIRQELETMGVKELSVRAVSEAVIRIRTAKLPDPAKIGNAGSFFKNPEVAREKYEQLQKDHPDIVAYPLPEGGYKLAAGWLIEQCGWKGYREGDAGVHARQALVLVNYGGASGADIYRLSEKIAESVAQRYGVQLEREVNVY